MTEPALAVAPSDLNGYLESAGWRREGTSRGALVWALEPGRRLIVPERREYEDDDELLIEAVRSLASVEDRPELDVVLDISEPLVDAQFYRMQPDTPSGTIPLPAGLKAVQSVHDLMRAAAITTEQGPQLLIEQRRDALVDRFLRRVSLGSARPGSYILTSRVPVGSEQRESEEAAGQQQLDLPSSSLALRTISGGNALAGRRVVSNLYAAVSAAHEAARSMLRTGEQFGAFYDGVENGVSANLCRALADLGSFGRRRASSYRPFEVGFGWARARPAGEPSKPIAFSENMVGVLAAAADELANLARSGRARLVGQVETLKRPPGEEPRIRIIGDLRIEAGPVLRKRSVWVAVGTDDYEAAWDAQQNGRTVTVDGQLGMTRGRLQMEISQIEIARD